MLFAAFKLWQKRRNPRTNQARLGSGRRRRTARRTNCLSPALGARFEHLEARVLLSATSLDPTFGSGGKVITDIGGSTSEFGNAVAVYQSDGKFVVTGNIGGPPGPTGPDFAVVRYNPDGSLDTTFGTGDKAVVDFGGTHDFSLGVAVDSQDRIIVVGESYQGGPGTTDFAVARLLTDGSLDTSFAGDGKHTIDFGGTSDAGRSVAVDSLDRIVISGVSASGNAGEDFAVARLTVDGALDMTFDADGKQTIDFGGSARSHGVAVDSQERVLVSGQ
jgi:uncharacterized delta-60 repeat protein